MKSIFSELPNDLIDKIVQIENDRKKYEKVVKHINKLTTYDKFCTSIREMMNGADDADPASMSTPEIWGWEENRLTIDTSWENVWYGARRERKE